MFCIKQHTLHLIISLFTFSRAFNTAINTKFIAYATRNDFSIESTASAIISEKLIALKVDI